MDETLARTAFWRQFVESTWIFWCVIAFVWAGIAAWIISSVYRRACEELRFGQTDAIGKRIQELPIRLQEDARQGRRKTSARRTSADNEYLENYSKIRLNLIVTGRIMIEYSSFLEETLSRSHFQGGFN
jgi:hypothetical protein